MTEETVLKAHLQDNGVGVLTLNRPHVRNALDENLIEAMSKQLLLWSQNEKCRLLVLKGEGKSFCAGADLNWMKKMVDYSYQQNVEEARSLSNLLRQFKSFPAPTIIAAQGHVYGGALGLVSCADIVLVDPQTMFCFSEVKLGLIPAVIMPFVQQAVQVRRVMPYMLTGRPFSAQEALALGFAHQVGPLKQHLAQVTEELIENSQYAQCALKDLMAHMPLNFNEVASYTSQHLAKIRISDDAQNRMKCFLKAKKTH